jgi:hypothetical protein
MADVKKFQPASDLYTEVGLTVPFGKGSGDSKPSVHFGTQTWDSNDSGQDPLPEDKGDPVGKALKKLRDNSAHGSGYFTEADIKKGFKLMPTMGS